MFITIRTTEEDYIDLNVQMISYVQSYYTKDGTKYRLYVGQSIIDINESQYTGVLEPVLYKED